MEELIIRINLIGLMVSMLSTTPPIGNHNHEMEKFKKTYKYKTKYYYFLEWLENIVKRYLNQII